MSADEYHADTSCIGGSALFKILNDCPAAWRFAGESKSQALADGTAAHAAILEPDLFADQYARGISALDYPNALRTVAEITARIKEVGTGGASGKSKSQLIELLATADPDAQVLDTIIEQHAKANDCKQIVDPTFYDSLEKMRFVIFSDPEYRAAFFGAKFEVSAFLHDVGVKCRFDCVTKNGEIWDYKTTVSANPELFAASAYKYGYWLKMALQHDIYESVFNEKPRRVVLLEQSKTAPYIAQAYEISEEQLSIGREQYRSALELYLECKERDSWPAYGGGVMPLPTPNWAARLHGIDNDEIQITEV
jgi:hypothetical protein